MTSPRPTLDFTRKAPAVDVLPNVSGDVVLHQNRDNVFVLQLVGDVTSMVFANEGASVAPETNGKTGQRIELHFVQDTIGGHTVELPDAVVLNDTPFTLSTGAGKRDVLTLRQTADDPPQYREIARTLDSSGIAALVGGKLDKTANLGDLPNAGTARTNLGLAAVAASGSASDITSGTLADARIPASITRDSELASAVSAAVAGLVGAAPDALNTIYELAAQLLADESAAAALTTVVAGKLAKTANLSDLADPATARANLGAASARVGKTCRIYASGTGQEIASGSLDRVLLNTLDGANEDPALFTPDLTTGIVTVNVDCRVLAIWSTRFGNAPLGQRYSSVAFDNPGGTRREIGSTFAENATQNGTGTLRITAGTQVMLAAYVDGGSPVPINSGALWHTGLSLTYLGPIT